MDYVPGGFTARRLNHLIDQLDVLAASVEASNLYHQDNRPLTDQAEAQLDQLGFHLASAVLILVWLAEKAGSDELT